MYCRFQIKVDITDQRARLSCLLGLYIKQQELLLRIANHDTDGRTAETTGPLAFLHDSGRRVPAIKRFGTIIGFPHAAPLFSML